MLSMVTDYRGHRRTLLPIREINLKACMLDNLTEIIGQTSELNPGLSGNTDTPGTVCIT